MTPTRFGTGWRAERRRMMPLTRVTSGGESCPSVRASVLPVSAASFSCSRRAAAAPAGRHGRPPGRRPRGGSRGRCRRARTTSSTRRRPTSPSRRTPRRRHGSPGASASDGGWHRDPGSRQAIRRLARRGRGGPLDPRRRVPGAARLIGVREDDPAPHDRGARATHVGRDPHRRPARGRRRAAARPRNRDGVPELRPVPPPYRVPEHRLPARGEPHAAEAARGESAVGGRHVRHLPLPRSLPPSALGRGTPARCAVPRPGAGSQGVSSGRAPGQSRRQAAQHGPRRSEAVPAPDPDHHGVRDPRPGGGDGTRRPHRGDGARQDPAGRHAPRGLRGSGGHVRGDLCRPAAHEPARRGGPCPSPRYADRLSPRAFSPDERVRHGRGAAHVSLRGAARRVPGLRSLRVRLGGRERHARCDDHRQAARDHRARHSGRPDPRVCRAPARAALLRPRNGVEAQAVTGRTFADREEILGAVMLGPALAYVVLLVGVPFAFAIALGFSNATAGSLSFGWAGLHNYRAILADPIFLRALRNSVIVTVGSQVLVVILATAAAQVFRATFRGKRFARFVLLLPWAVPVSLAAIAWTWIFDSTFSVINWTLKAAGLLHGWLYWLGDPALALLAIIIVQAWRIFPFATVIVLAGLSSLPQEIVEAAIVDGAGFWRRLLVVELPLLMPVVAVAVLFGVVYTATDLGVVYILTGGGPANTTHVRM